MKRKPSNRGVIFAAALAVLVLVGFAMPDPASAAATFTSSPCSYVPARLGPAGASSSKYTQEDKNFVALLDLCNALKTAGPGTKSGTGVAVAESGSTNHVTTFTLTSTPVVTADHTTSGGSGGLLIYTFPEGIIQGQGCVANLTTLSSGSITSTAAVVVSLGSVTAGADATLTSTEADFVASMAATETASAGAATGYNATTASWDGHATPVAMFLNVAMPDAASSGAGQVAVSGTIRCTWTDLGDF